MKVTIVDVAKACNVSVATVSRVLNDNYPVKEQTKEKVLEVVKNMNYKPNSTARDLSKQNSTTIGVIVPSINNMFFTDVINGIEDYFENTDYSIFLCVTNNEKQKEDKKLNELISRNVAGIIIIDPNIENLKLKTFDNIAKTTPIVFVNGYSESPNISIVENNQIEGSLIAMRYLIENNHRDIAFIRGNKSYSYDIKEQVYEKITKEFDIYNKDYILNIERGNSIETVNKSMEYTIRLLEDNDKISAIFACNDLMAMGAMNACKKLYKNIPEDVSIIGFDNIELSQMIEPKLTTIDQNMFLLGQNASKLLNEKIDKQENVGRRIILDNFLVKRDT